MDQLPFMQNRKMSPEYIFKTEIKPTPTSRTLTVTNEHWMLRNKIIPNARKQSKTHIYLALKPTEAATGILCINLGRLWISLGLYKNKGRLTENIKSSNVCIFQ